MSHQVYSMRDKVYNGMDFLTGVLLNTLNTVGVQDESSLFWSLNFKRTHQLKRTRSKLQNYS